MNEEKITIWEERIHACQNSDLTVAAWCREHQISVATYYYWRKRVSANDEMLSVKEPVFAELTNIRKAALSEEKKPLLISCLPIFFHFPLLSPYPFRLLFFRYSLGAVL